MAPQTTTVTIANGSGKNLSMTVTWSGSGKSAILEHYEIHGHGSHPVKPHGKNVGNGGSFLVNDNNEFVGLMVMLTNYPGIEVPFSIDCTAENGVAGFVFYCTDGKEERSDQCTMAYSQPS